MVPSSRIWRAINNGKTMYVDGGFFFSFDYVARDKSEKQETLGQDGW